MGPLQERDEGNCEGAKGRAASKPLREESPEEETVNSAQARYGCRSLRPSGGTRTGVVREKGRVEVQRFPRRCLLGLQRIGVERGTGFDVLADFSLKRLLLAVGNNNGANLS